MGSLNNLWFCHYCPPPVSLTHCLFFWGFFPRVYHNGCIALGYGSWYRPVNWVPTIWGLILKGPWVAFYKMFLFGAIWHHTFLNGFFFTSLGTRKQASHFLICPWFLDTVLPLPLTNHPSSLLSVFAVCLHFWNVIWSYRGSV